MTLLPRIDEHACLGHGDCAVIAPEAFAVTDVAVIIGTTDDERLRACARACPAGAVMLFDAESGEEVDP